MDDQRKDDIDPLKEKAQNYYKCLPMTWKILMAQIKEEIYDSLTSHRFSPEERKGWHKWTRGTGELL